MRTHTTTKQPTTMITSTVETITPSMATKYLEFNKGNRPMNPKNVRMYAEEMRSGNWLVTDSGIGFDTNGRLTNGQNRLKACILAGVAFPCLVTRGLAPQVFAVTDVHGVRSGGQIAAIAGVINSRRAMSVITSHLIYEASAGRAGITYSAISVSSRAKLAMISADPERVQHSLLIARRAYGSCGVIIPALLGGLHYTVCKTMPEQADAFVDAIGSGENMRASDPRMALRNRLIERSTKAHKERVEYMMALHIYAWNAFVEGRLLKKMTYRSGDPIPKLIR